MAKLSKKLSFKEEVGNTITHGVGACAMLILLPISAIYAYTHLGLKLAIGISIFVISLFLMFISSTIYHAMGYNTPQKHILRIIDHSMIFIAISGSYTPVILALFDGWLSIFLICLQWGLSLFGILYRTLSKNINEKLNLALYIGMGWIVVFILPVIIQKATPIFIILIALGGICYTVGAIFYTQKKPYFHMIWHFFILAAALLQYIAIVFFIA